MPRRKVSRNPDEEAAFQRVLCERNAANQRRRHMIARNQMQMNQEEENSNNLAVERSVTHNLVCDEDAPLERIRPQTLHEFELPSTSTIDVHINWNTVPVPTTQRLNQFRSRRRNIIDVGIHNARQLIDITQHYIGAMDISCSHCGAKHFATERVLNRANSCNDCCSHGEVSLDALLNPPSILRNLFSGSHPKTNDFYARIRCYNSSFSFASFNANLSNFSNRRSGPYCFKKKDKYIIK